MVIKCVFFDFDGTISDAKGIALRSLSKTLREFGYEVDKKRLEGLLGVKMGRMLRMLNIDGNIEDEKTIRAIRKRFYEYFTDMAVQGGIRPCVSLKPLWKMKEDGVPLIVISNSKKSFLRASIKTLEIEGLFDRVYGADDFDYKDEMLVKCFGKMKISPDEAIYVGDRFSDVQFAKKAGCVSVAINNKCSFSSLDRIRKENPDYIVRDFYGLRKLVKVIR